jgi:hypothetical protein
VYDCAKSVEMAQLTVLSVILLCCIIGLKCAETSDSAFKDEVQFVLDSFNDRPGSLYVYESAKIINAYTKVSKVLKLKVVIYAWKSFWL